MPRRVLIIVGHPDPNPDRFCRRLAEAYAGGARAAGHELRWIDLAAIDFPMLRTSEEFKHGPLPESLRPAADAIAWAEHIVFVFPLWLGTMPALLKAFLEQTIRPGIAFAYRQDKGSGFPKTLLNGRSARLIVTMGMPAFFYRIWYLGHGVSFMRRNILNFVGIKPVRVTQFGAVEAVGAARRGRWVERMRKMGERAL
jgi:putative NADPH-quinone reductase